MEDSTKLYILNHADDIDAGVNDFGDLRPELASLLSEDGMDDYFTQSTTLKLNKTLERDSR
jgi:hypothetical protein